MEARAVLFDVDGTLVDSVDAHALAWQEALAAYGHRIAFRRIRSQIGKGGDQLIPVFLSAKERRLHAKEIEAYRMATFRAKYLPKIKPFPRVAALFKRLRADGWKVALASSSNKEDLKAYIDVLGVAKLVDVVTSADDAGESKPEPDIFLAAQRKLRRIPAERCVVIGDSPYDHIAAKKAGMTSVGVLSGGFTRASLLAAGASDIYRDPADLLRQYAKSILAGP